ncbi:MAG: peptidase [Candidatus Heimdallarchaeaceae archaeon]
MVPPLTVFYDPKLDYEEIKTISEQLERTFGIKIKEIRKNKLGFRAYNWSRKQFDGQKLLNRLIDNENYRFFFWIVKGDLYVPVMSFVFGLASKYYGALVSFHRLDSSEMKIKESVHECGHIYGLEHCLNSCVMQYSTSLEEAEKKPSLLCEDCLQKIEKNLKNI